MTAVTMRWLRKERACGSGIAWWKENGRIADPGALANTLLSVDAKWAVWLVAHQLSHCGRVRLAVYCATLALPNWQKYASADRRPQEAIAAAMAWLRNPTPANAQKAVSARDAALSAGYAAWSAGHAALSAGYAALSAEYAAGSAGHAAGSAGHAAGSAGYAAWSAGYAALSAEDAARSATYIRIVRYGVRLMRKEGK